MKNLIANFNGKNKLEDGTIVDKFTLAEKYEALAEHYEYLEDSYKILTRMYDKLFKCSMCVNCVNSSGITVPKTPCNSCSNGRYANGNDFDDMFSPAAINNSEGNA